MKMFTAAEAKNLDYTLSQVADCEASLYLEELHGFLFGLAVTPEPIMPSEWFPVVFGKDGPLFDDERNAQECIGHLMAAYNRIMKDYNEGRLKFPFDYSKITDDDFELVEGWAYGLFLALSLRPHLWEMSEDHTNKNDDAMPEEIKDLINSCCIVTAIAIPEERDGIFEALPGHTNKTDEEMEDILFGMLPVCVDIIREHGQKLHKKMFPGAPEQGSRPAGKVGRNELCPCGSGRKYKKCCGGN
ncbi:MAG: hypothetical protein CVU54_15485 [Deltaproteobacteria bacterium HGW-Deltaproteobacteria-12]|jgi:uncharacterized protein|nr:MAG: hypothetical protein CVU54_15485 [Deltaproteobacteria bacterium HGW-Deltaproteobacteria-12]